MQHHLVKSWLNLFGYCTFLRSTKINARPPKVSTVVDRMSTNVPSTISKTVRSWVSIAGACNEIAYPFGVKCLKLKFCNILFAHLTTAQSFFNSQQFQGSSSALNTAACHISEVFTSKFDLSQRYFCTISVWDRFLIIYVIQWSDHLHCYRPKGAFKIKMPSYQYRNSQCGDMTILWRFSLHNGISYTGEMTFSYWIWIMAEVLITRHLLYYYDLIQSLLMNSCCRCLISNVAIIYLVTPACLI